MTEFGIIILVLCVGWHFYERAKLDKKVEQYFEFETNNIFDRYRRNINGEIDYQTFYWVFFRKSQSRKRQSRKRQSRKRQSRKRGSRNLKRENVREEVSVFLARHGKMYLLSSYSCLFIFILTIAAGIVYGV